jgi:hypothetical protein
MATAKYTGKDTRVTVIINDVSPLGFFAWRCGLRLVWCGVLVVVCLWIFRTWIFPPFCRWGSAPQDAWGCGMCCSN